MRAHPLLLTIASSTCLAVAAVAAADLPPNLGDARPDSVRLDPIEVRDPAGGPGWGVRTFATTHGRVCVEASRRLERRIGVVDDAGVFHESEPGDGAWLCGDRAPGDPPHAYSSMLTYHDRSGRPAECNPFPSSPDDGPKCVAAATRTVLVVWTGPALTAVRVRRGRSWQRVVIPRGGQVFLHVRRGVVRVVRLELVFRGGCDPAKRKVLLKFRDARRVGCRVVVPNRIG